MVGWKVWLDLSPLVRTRGFRVSGCVESPKSPNPGCGSTVGGNFVGMWALGVANNYLQILSVAYIYICYITAKAPCFLGFFRGLDEG